MNRLALCLMGLILTFMHLFSRESDDSSKFNFSGYISVMPSLFWMGNSTSAGTDSALWQTVLHNRLNLKWFPSEHFSSALELRNQIQGGDFIIMADPSSGFKKENYYLPLTYYQSMGDQFLLSLSIDRLWFQYTNKRLEIKAGRQRINWGQTFVWNPNDLFNSYNFFDFDYPERPGADAIRLQYYTSSVSSLDIAMKIDSSGDISGAGLYRFNKWNTDFQLLGGIVNQTNPKRELDTIVRIDHDLVGGLGFSGGISSLSLRGELSYFYSLKENADSTNLLLLSIATDYSFSNQLYLMFEFLYNNNILAPEGSSIVGFNKGNQGVKTLTYTKYNFFGQVSYPISPLLNSSIGGMFFTDDNMKGFYAGPTIDLSLGNNLTLSGIYQFIAFKTKDLTTGKQEWINSSYAFARFKWNF
jgi:hypothetical protein